MRGSRLAHVVTFLLIGSLVVVGQARRIYQDHHVNITANATAVESPFDEDKLALKWCVARECDPNYPGEGFNQPCSCCFTLPGAPCWHTMNECQAKCPTCHPTC
ncbi:hypothetical protein ACQJBY_041222 [Aegilops geniculata]